MTRFFAHLCLFLQIIEIPTPAVETQVILEVYLGVLEVGKCYTIQRWPLILGV